MSLESRRKIEAMLAELCASLGIEPVALCEEGLCAFDYRNELSILIEVPQAESVVLIRAALLPIPAKGTRGLFRYLLTHNFTREDTAGAAFGIDPSTNEITLTIQQDIEALDQQAFENLLENFITLARHWQQELANRDNVHDEVDPTPDQEAMHRPPGDAHFFKV